MFSPIHHVFGPHVTVSYALKALGLLLWPPAWQRGKVVEELRCALKAHFTQDTHLFASGRQALLAILRSIDLRPGEEVIIQGYTCIVLPNAIHAAGGVPVYADIDPESLNLTPESVKARITNRTRAIICQHTFGIPADVRGLRELCDEKNLTFIEDCAHVLPEHMDATIVGSFGDCLFFSFGRDKAISGITGGCAVSRKSEITERLYAEEAKAEHMSAGSIGKLLCYPLVYLLARPFIGLGVGKAFLLASRALGLLVPMYAPGEKSGSMNPKLQKLPNACAALALQSFQHLEHINNHRRKLAGIYLEAAKTKNWTVPHHANAHFPLQKLPILLPDASSIRQSLKRKNIHLDDGWTSCTVCPVSADPESANYTLGQTPNADLVSQKILSLPTHPTMTEKQARKLIDQL